MSLEWKVILFCFVFSSHLGLLNQSGEQNKMFRNVAMDTFHCFHLFLYNYLFTVAVL